jgi:xanthine dehydrogenase large subunit
LNCAPAWPCSAAAVKPLTAAALAGAPQRLGGRFVIGAQDQFYLEGQIAYALPREDGQMLVHNSTQHPGEVQYQVAHALGIEAHRVVVECRRMGGGFGGKESQAALFACVAALLAQATGRPVKYRADRDDDMLITGKRHDFTVDYKAGFDQSGLLLGLDLALASRCGYSADLSGPVNDRAMTHADNCYVLENIEIISHRCKTNMQSATAFRGFGGPQGMLATEQVLDEIARHLGMDALDVRRRNFYQPGVRDVTHYGQKLEDFIMPALFDALEQSSDYRARRQQINAWNASQPVIRRGLAITPVKFGISFTSTMLNQAGALVNVYTDGTVLVSHGGTEIGQVAPRANAHARTAHTAHTARARDRTGRPAHTHARTPALAYAHLLLRAHTCSCVRTPARTHPPTSLTSRPIEVG